MKDDRSRVSAERGFRREARSGIAACVEDGVEEAVAEKALAQVEPDALDGIKLRRVGRQVERRDSVRPVEVACDVPARPVHDEHGMPIGGELAGEFVDKRLHGGHARLRQHEGHACVAPGQSLRRSCNLVAHVFEASRSDAALVPDTAGAADLSDASLVLEPQLDCAAVRPLLGDPLQSARESFSKRSRAAGSAFGWLGRVF